MIWKQNLKMKNVTIGRYIIECFRAHVTFVTLQISSSECQIKSFFLSLKHVLAV